MTKRIKQLAKDAGLVNRRFMFGKYYEDDLTDEQQKFAELIVRECSNYMNSRIPGNIEVAYTVAKMKQRLLGVKDDQIN